MLPSFLNWLNLTVDQAQALSRVSFGLLVVVLVCLVIGLGCKLSSKGVHWIALISFSACLLMGFVTSILYFWHHWIRL